MLHSFASCNEQYALLKTNEPKIKFQPDSIKSYNATGVGLSLCIHNHSNVSGPQDFDADSARDTVDGA